MDTVPDRREANAATKGAAACCCAGQLGPGAALDNARPVAGAQPTATRHANRRRAWRRGQSGASITEFALMAPLITLTVYYTMFLNDLTIFRIETLGAARLAAFGMADRMASNYRRATPGSYTMSPVRGETIDFVERVYGDLSAMTMDDAGGEVFHGLMSARLQRIVVEDQPAPAFPGGVNYQDYDNGEQSSIPGFTSFLSGLAEFTNDLYSKAGFHTQGMTEVEVRVRVKNHLLDIVPDSFSRLPVVPEAFRQGVIMRENLALVTDSWKLEDGRDIHGINSGVEGSGSGYEDMMWGNRSPYHAQVDRMWLASAKGRIQDLFGGGVGGAIAGSVTNWLLSQIPGDPFNPRVASHAYRESEEDGMIDVYELSGVDPIDQAVRRHHTMPMQLDPNGNEDSGYQDALGVRGEFYMCCPTAAADPCQY